MPEAPRGHQNACQFEGQSLLCVFAHPDDESLASGGLLAWCAGCGIRVTVVCLTRGEHGPRGGLVPAQAPPSALGAVRAAELRSACRVLGADAVLLDYEDGMLPWIDAARVEDDLARLIVRLRPDVVVTFDLDGLYWHPDHVAVHERTTAAVQRLGDRAPALYYVTLPPDAMRAVVREAGLAATSPCPGGTAGPLDPVPGVHDPGAFGAAAPPPTIVADVSRQAAAKLRALHCHATQVAGSALAFVTTGTAPRLLGREHYRRAGAGSRAATFLDTLAEPCAPCEPVNPE